MVRTYPGHFAARAAQKKLDELESRQQAQEGDPLTEYYGAQDIVYAAHREQVWNILRRFGFYREWQFDVAINQGNWGR